MRRGIVLIEISFNVEKDKARFPIAHDEIEIAHPKRVFR